MKEINTRVVAIRDVDPQTKKVHIYGLGVYIGDKKVPHGTRTPFGVVDKDLDGWENPCIRLDNGGIVWGCQCWWGPVERVQKQYAGFHFEEVDTPLRNPPLPAES